MAEAAAFGEIVVLAVKGTAAESALDLCGAANLAGKAVIDTTNPIAAAPPVSGVLRYFTSLDDSLMERLQRRVPEAHFVKAFSCVGNNLMVDPKLAGGPPTMFMCGNHEGAKSQVKAIVTDFGWEIEDLGAAEAARAIEPLCMLWCIPGVGKGDWSPHAGAEGLAPFTVPGQWNDNERLRRRRLAAQLAARPVGSPPAAGFLS
jgi:predicted dinucleotide-binding enzyme